MMYLDTVKWGFIGCGEAIETKSGPAFSMIENSEVVAVMSREEAKAKSYAERHGINKYFTDPQSLINDPEVNAVYIATPPSSHSTYAIMSMRSGKPCYVEKPLANNYDECLRINRTSTHTQTPCFVAYYRRYLPYFQKVIELIKSGVIGHMLNTQIQLNVPPRELDSQSGMNLPWRLNPQVAGGGGYFYDLASHQLDLLQYMFGDIIEAEGYCKNMAGLYLVEDTFNACFRFHSGLQGSGSWCFVSHESARKDLITIVGTKGTITFSVFDYKPIVLYNEAGIQSFDVKNPRYVQMPLIKQIVEHLLGKGTCDCDSFSATPSNWVMDKILGRF